MTIQTANLTIVSTPIEQTVNGIVRTGHRIVWTNKVSGKVELDHIVWDEMEQLKLDYEKTKTI